MESGLELEGELQGSFAGHATSVPPVPPILLRGFILGTVWNPDDRNPVMSVSPGCVHPPPLLSLPDSRGIIS